MPQRNDRPVHGLPIAAERRLLAAPRDVPP
jgi:hypothetical protein